MTRMLNCARYAVDPMHCLQHRRHVDHAVAACDFHGNDVCAGPHPCRHRPCVPLNRVRRRR